MHDHDERRTKSTPNRSGNHDAAEICQRVFHSTEVFAHMRADEDQKQLIALAYSLRDSLNVVGMLADSAGQKIGGAAGNYFDDPIEWMMPPVYPRQTGNGHGSGGRIEGV